ncbi:MAG: 23S rRNA (adenine(2503)-C(2))-methyltransferase RlmN [Eubacteriales bacterium]|nr:23S rRNA (adenine(2503)-C(2))-methyltransferase RlmN [Eubacteriales bacterium]
MPEKRILLDLTQEELGAYLKEISQPAFRAKQLYGWLNHGVAFSDMSNLPKELREQLDRECYDLPMSIQQSFPSQKDDTVKFLFRCHDDNLIEGVLMRYHYGYSLCISTQIGCKMGCAFCASTLNGCVRSLSAGEMLAEVILANRFLGEKGHVGHVVLMGSGEPLDNYDAVLRFLRLLNHKDGLNLSLRNVSLSTCGLTEQIRRLAGENLGITLSLSLHAPNDAIRTQIMPVARRYPLNEVMGAVREYVKLTGRRVVFEYALIDGLNSRPEHARELAKLAAGLQCHVNLIPLNRVEERALRPATPEAVQTFLKTLESLHVSATVRREMGSDIGGACGQLRRRHLQTEQ